MQNQAHSKPTAHPITPRRDSGKYVTFESVAALEGLGTIVAVGVPIVLVVMVALQFKLLLQAVTQSWLIPLGLALHAARHVSHAADPGPVCAAAIKTGAARKAKRDDAVTFIVA